MLGYGHGKYGNAYSTYILTPEHRKLPAGNDYEQARKGAYVVAGSDEDFDVILLADGSEVSTLVAGAELLRKDGIKIRIVSVPSEGLFRNQSKEYQESILPKTPKYLA